MEGKVYVTVQASDANTYSARAAGSEGATTFSGTVTWSFNGGISGQYGWDSPKKVNYVEGNVEATNDAVYRAYQGASILDLIAIGNCVIMN